MKAIIFIVCMLIVSTSFAGETTTECPMMKELNERTNPKENLNNQRPKIKTTKQATAQ